LSLCAAAEVRGVNIIDFATDPQLLGLSLSPPDLRGKITRQTV